jgi:polar amino acid transport system substrate-binding protein
VLKRFNEALRSLPAHYGLPVPDPLRQDGDDAQPASAGAEEEVGNVAGE